jgi:hypothetical protein
MSTQRTQYYTRNAAGEYEPALFWDDLTPQEQDFLTAVRHLQRTAPEVAEAVRALLEAMARHVTAHPPATRRPRRQRAPQAQPEATP